MKYNEIDFLTLLTVLSVSGREYTEKYTIETVNLPIGEDPQPAKKKGKANQLIVHALVKGTSTADINATIRDNIAPLLSPEDPLEYKTLIFEDDPDLQWMAMQNGPISRGKHKPFYTEISIPFLAKNHVYSITETMIEAITPFDQISGTITGTAPSRGVISFEIDATPPSSIIITYATASISIFPPAGFDLEGEWTIDLAARNIKKDGVLAMEYIDFENTNFEKFKIMPGSFTINLSEEPLSADYIFRAEYK